MEQGPSAGAFSARTCVRPPVSATEDPTAAGSDWLPLRLETSPRARDSLKTPDSSKDRIFPWITNYGALSPRPLPRAAVTVAARHRYAASSDTSPLVVLQRETCHPRYWPMSRSCRSYTPGEWRTLV